MRLNYKGLTTVGALLVCAGVSWAQEGNNDFSQPLGGGKAQQSTGVGNSRTMLKSVDGDDEYEVVIENGQVSAKVNGKKVPAERIRRSADKVEILDKSGKVLKSFEVSTDGAWGGAKNWRRVPQDNAQPMDIAAAPKVMIGITMTSPSEALADHLGIKPEEAIEVEKVFEGLSADKAGLKAKDIIIEVDGARPVTQLSFREKLNKKEPGDKVELKILRKGEEQKLTVELQRFDGEKLGWQKAPEGQQFDLRRFDPENNPDWQKQMEEAMRNSMKLHGPDGQVWVWGNGPDGNFKFVNPGGDAKRLDEMQTQMDKKMAELDAKLAKINEQMARLEKLLNKLGEKGAKE